MAHIRLTVQKPGETEAHDVILDEEFSNDDKGTESADVSERYIIH